MRILRFLLTLIFLISASVQADTAGSPVTCQKMFLSLLNNFDINQQKSKEQIFQFANKCMPESALSNKSQSFNQFQLSEDITGTKKLSIRM